jgi:hypothetical protein
LGGLALVLPALGRHAQATARHAALTVDPDHTHARRGFRAALTAIQRYQRAVSRCEWHPK